MIEMAENSDKHIGTYICIFNKGFSEVLLLWRTKEERDGEIIKGWGLVGGTVEPGEEPLQASIREAKEELGVYFEPNNLILVGMKTSPETSPHKWEAYFYAACVDESIAIKLSNESRGYGWFCKDELPEGTLDSKEDILGWWARAENASNNS